MYLCVTRVEGLYGESKSLSLTCLLSAVGKVVARAVCIGSPGLQVWLCVRMNG